METKTEALPKTLPPLDSTRYYSGYFMYENRRTEPKCKTFAFNGMLHDAIHRFSKHCGVMGYRFISVRPFMVDLDEQEQRKLSNPEYLDEFAG